MNTTSLTALFSKHKERGRYTIIEGDPGAGKTSVTTTAERVVSNSVVLKEFNHIEQSDNAYRGDQKWIQNWYMANECERQAKVHHLLTAGNHVIQDRSVLSTLAFAYATHEQSKPDKFLDVLQRRAAAPAFIAPDTLFIMQVEPIASLERRRAFREAHAYSIWFDASFLARFHAFFKNVASLNLAAETIVIDTSSMSLDEVKRSIVSQLQHGPDRVGEPIR